MMTVGFTAAPVAAIDVGGVSVDGDDGVTVESGDQEVTVDGDELDQEDTSDLESVVDELDQEDISDLESVVDELDNQDDPDVEAFIGELENQDDPDLDALVEELENMDNAEVEALIEELENQEDADLDAILEELDTESGVDDAPVDSGDAPADLSDAPVPEEVCTDAGETIEEEVPVEDVPWLSDLPEEAQPPNVPAQLVTPQTGVSIVTGVTPNQCEVQDPSDPSYDPLADGVDPDAGVTPAQGDYKDGFWGLVVYEATLDQSGSGPSASGMIWTLGSTEDGTIDTDVTINDGEKNYEINPTVGFADDGTGHADIEAWAINNRVGTGVDCDGEECKPDANGVPATDAPAVPVPTGQDGDDDSSQSEFEVPQEVCTDVGDQVHDEVPWSEVPWDELTSEVQPPGVPTNIVTPRAISSIVWGFTPNQCDIQDPNDPTFDPREDDIDPDASISPAQGDYKDGLWGLVLYEATLDQSGSGPSVSGTIWTLGASEDGTMDPDVTINDGEKDYAINPRVDYSSAGTGYAVTDFWVFGKTFGVEMTCDGEECHPDTRSLPKFEEYPSIPAPTGQDDAGGDSDDSDDSDNDSGSDDDGSNDTSGSTGSSDSGTTDSTQTSAGGAGTAGGSGGQAAGSDDGTDGSSDDADTSNDAEADTDDNSDGDDADDSNDDADDSSDGESDDEYESEPADEPVESAAESDGDGAGFGVGLAVLSVLFTTLMARRRLS